MNRTYTAYALFLTMGCVQLGVMVSAVSGWIGSTVLALIISFVSAWIPIPWFLIGHWYFEGTLPWIYISAWIVGWGTLTLATLMARDEPEDEEKMNIEHDASLSERARLAKERDEFVAEMGIEGLIDLHITAGLNLPVLTKSLLDQGGDVHARDEQDHTPLHYAAWRNAPETAAVLLDNGADVHARDEKSATPLHSAALGNACTTVKVLLSNGADVHARDEQDHTPLHYAADGNASETATVLLNNGADVHAKNKDGKTSLHLVAVRNASETAAVLLDNGADVHARDAAGTPLHWAARENASETAAVLLNNGADVHAKTKDGVTPLQVAEVLKTHETAEIMNNHLIHSILATGDGSLERPYVVSSVKEEDLILKHWNKIKTMQTLMDVDGKPMDCIGCEDGATYYFDISTFFRQFR